MKLSIISALIAAVPPLILAITTILVNNRLIIYRVDQVEKKVDNQDPVLERTVILEQKMNAAFSRIDELKGDLKYRNE